MLKLHRNDAEAAQFMKDVHVTMSDTAMLVSASPVLKYMVWVPAIHQLSICNKRCQGFYKKMYDNFCTRYKAADENTKKAMEMTTMFDIMQFEKADSGACAVSELSLFVLAGMRTVVSFAIANEDSASGYETTAHALVWIFHDLMRYPHVSQMFEFGLL
jgi:hypothetical protein